MKLSRAFLGIAATALAVLPVAFAQAQTSGVGNAALAAEKQIATALATAAVNVLTAFEQKVQNASNLTSATQQAIVSSMNTTIAQLNSYKTTIAAVTTQSDLTSANQQLQSYIAGHKTIVEQNFQLAMEDLASQLVTRTNAFYINAQALVPQLQTACPSQASLIASTEQQIGQLDSDSVALQGMIQNHQSGITIRSQIATIADLMNSISSNIHTIESACNIPVANPQ